MWLLFGKHKMLFPANLLKILVHLEGETSNTLFEELAGWNEYLKREDIDPSTPKTSREPGPGSQGPSL